MAGAATVRGLGWGCPNGFGISLDLTSLDHIWPMETQVAIWFTNSLKSVFLNCTSKTGGCSNYRRKCRSQTSDNMDRWKSRGGKSQRKTKSQKKEDAGARTGRKAAKHCVFRWFVGLLKRRVRSHVARWEIKSCTPLWREERFEAKSWKNWGGSEFGAPFEVKSVRRCGAKHMSKSKVEETEGFGALLDVWLSFCLVGTRDSAPCQKRTKRFQLQPPLHYNNTNYITLHYTNYNYNPNHFTLHYATLQ